MVRDTCQQIGIGQGVMRANGAAKRWQLKLLFDAHDIDVMPPFNNAPHHDQKCHAALQVHDTSPCDK